MAISSFNTFADSKGLVETLAAEITRELDQIVSRDGRAVLAVSGGTTPVALFRAMSEIDIDWHLVTVLPVDERDVDPTSDRSNEKLIRENLLIDYAARADFLPLRPAEGEDLDSVGSTISRHPVDVCILGMGADGHTASWFPGGDNLIEALDANSMNNLLSMEAPGAGEKRFTLTLPVVVQAKHIVLHIEGEAKRKAFEEAVSGDNVNDMPIRRLIHDDQIELHVYWCQ